MTLNLTSMGLYLHPNSLWGAAFFAFFITLPAQWIDDNGNGLSDVWEAAHGGTLLPDVDQDGDGFTNLQEAACGTDPANSASFPFIREVQMGVTGQITNIWPTVAGIRYRTLVSTNMLEWQPVGSPVIGTGADVSQVLDFSATILTGDVDFSKWNLTQGVSTLKQYVANGVPVPDSTEKISLLKTVQSDPDVNDFGEFSRGWIVPSESGNHTFWIAGDDACEFWLSTNSDPANKQLTASVDGWTAPGQWNKYPTQKSAEIQLQAGVPYFFELFHKEDSGGDHVEVAWTRPGKTSATRETIGAENLTSSAQNLEEIAGGSDRLFFRLEISHTDSDGDGVSDYEEILLGLDPLNPTTTPRLPDAEAARRLLASPSTVNLGVATARGYEAGALPAEFVVFRTGGIGPITVPYTVSGSAVSGIDYEPLPGTISFAAGVRSVKIPIIPLPDGEVEAAETVNLKLAAGTGFVLGSPLEASVTIDDSPDVLHIAQLRTVPGIGSGGSGTAAVRRDGNSLSSMVSLSFGGLGSEVVSAEIFHSLDGAGGPTVFTFPTGQVQGAAWDFGPTGGLSREQILDALASGELWVRINTTGAAGAEIIGQLLTTHAWQIPPSLPAPPPAPTHATDTGEAARFLTQTTFGPNEASLTELTGNSYAQWIDSQFALPPTLHQPAYLARRDQLLARDQNDGWQRPRNEIWWQHALTAPDQLRQRMAFALSQIFVISQFGALDGSHEEVTLYYDMLLENSFGNYRDLLENVTLSPVMGTYLSMIRNRKPDPVTGHEPDENYAREIMQLMSVGLSETHLDGSLKLDAEGMPIPTYTQNDTVELAHIFTGWGAHYDPANPPQWSNGDTPTPRDWFHYGWDRKNPMTIYPPEHDTTERTILGGNVIPAGSDGRLRLKQALDIIFSHPNVGPFMAKQLIQKFVTSNPSPSYIARVAAVFNDDGNGVRGNLGATLKAVLLDYEARDPAPRASFSYGKPSEPLLRMSRMFRAIPANLPRSEHGDPNYYFNFQYSIPEQVPLVSPSVFNFFQPGFANPGAIARQGLLSPEFQIFGETNGLRQANQIFGALHWGIWTTEQAPNGDHYIFRFDYTDLVAILNSPGISQLQAQNLLLDHLDQRFLFGKMSPQLRAEILAAYAALPGWFDTNPERQKNRAQMALYLILNSPEFFVQR